jgi:hypothetical protein
MGVKSPPFKGGEKSFAYIEYFPILCSHQNTIINETFIRHSAFGIRHSNYKLQIANCTMAVAARLIALQQKTARLIALLPVILCNHAFAQTTDWKISGNSVTTDSKLGTNTGYSLIIETDNLERMRVTPLGNIGIGTASPSAQLEVAGDFKLGGQIRLGLFENASAENERIVYTNPDGTLMTMSREQMVGLMHTTACFMKPGAMYPSPTWQSEEGQYAGRLFTGTSCPAYVGIGTANPMTELDVVGSARINSNLVVGGEPLFDTNRSFQIGSYNDPALVVAPNGQLTMNFSGTNESPFVINHTSTGDQLFAVNRQGGIEITYQPEFNQDNPPQELLADIFRVRNGENNDDLISINSDGRIRCQGIVVKHPPFWPDYVFKPDYKLRPLWEVEDYIQQEGHLPGVPSETEIMNDGMDMQQLIVTLTEKVEELTLYIIQQQHEIDALNRGDAINRVPTVVPTPKNQQP